MEQHVQGQVSQSAAEVYEDFFVPALFRAWAERVADAAAVRPGQRVLDVACGTGVLARAVAERIGPESVVGLDANEGMLAVARRHAPAVHWQQGRAEELPSDDGAFDAVVSQFGLMFFQDRRRAVGEMARVLRPGGRLVVAVWDRLERTPGYAALADLVHRLLGAQAADALRPPFALGDPDLLRSLFDDARLAGVEVAAQPGTARFASLRSWIHTEIRGWTLADLVDDAQLEILLDEAERALRPFQRPDGSVAFDMPALLVTATRA